jgi:hypothetical protein
MSLYSNAAYDDELASPQPASEASDRSESAEDTHDSGRPIREFEALCAKHNLAYGAEENLAPFVHALGENKLLAMNFWSLVARLSDGRHGRALTQQEILAAIVAGVAGRGIEQAGPPTPAIDKLARLLAGEDVAVTSDEGRRPERLETVRPQLDLAETAHSTFSPHDLPETPRSSPLLEPAREPIRGPRLLLRPEPESDTLFDHADFRSLSGYAAADDRHKALRRAAAAVVLLVLGAGGWLLFAGAYSAWQRPGNSAHDAIASFAASSSAAFERLGDSVRAGVDSARDAWRGRPAAPLATGGGQAATVPLSVSPSQPPQPSEVRTGPAASRGSGVVAAKNDSKGIGPVYNNNDQSARRVRMHRARRAGPEAAPIVGDDEDLHGGERVVVSAAQMRDRLISSRVPILPDGVESRHSALVVLRATITSRGGVRDIHAVAGRPELRRSAIDAASAWRYRPYLLNGTPVDVATTITVNFNGND